MKIAVIGAGAWGTALAQVAAHAGEVTLWAREPEVAAEIEESHENAQFLPGVALDPKIRATSDLAEATAGAEAVLLVVPAQFLRAVARDLTPLEARRAGGALRQGYRGPDRCADDRGGGRCHARPAARRALRTQLRA